MFSKLTLVLLTAFVAICSGGQLHAQSFVVVVNEAGPSKLTKDEVARVFLKKSDALSPVDRERAAPTREAFSTTVLGRPAAAVVNFWQQQLFAGKEVPPPERDSDAAILAFVKDNPRAIGYVSANAAIGSGVKKLTIN